MSEVSTTSIWDQVQETDPRYTKQFNRGGGFKGTSTNATYLARKATEIFGPMGIGWGLDIVDENYVHGATLPGPDSDQRQIIHVVRVKLWYLFPATGERGEITQFGQTTFVGVNKHGSFTDEEAPKKSLTDAMTKCLSLLGFSADIFMGLYDDNKYLAKLQQKYNGNGDEPAPENLDPKVQADAKAFKAIWREAAVAYSPDPKNADWGLVEGRLAELLQGLGIEMKHLRGKKLTNEEVGRVLQAIEVDKKGGTR